uniref:Uncharacterized protein n=1 Tax=Guillardia theta TaxID=55529 RepID=A0A7S4UB45_GUITH|mmetsp:Transcript_48562/g.152311  ORF Transcript_48562/g.152311 Transcript_48562/m.152311 type:complete len:217 (+) Transcript_48562:577-1227(+)
MSRLSTRSFSAWISLQALRPRLTRQARRSRRTGGASVTGGASWTDRTRGARTSLNSRRSSRARGTSRASLAHWAHGSHGSDRARQTSLARSTWITTRSTWTRDGRLLAQTHVVPLEPLVLPAESMIFGLKIIEFLLVRRLDVLQLLLCSAQLGICRVYTSFKVDNFFLNSRNNLLSNCGGGSSTAVSPNDTIDRTKESHGRLATVGCGNGCNQYSC